MEAGGRADAANAHRNGVSSSRSRRRQPNWRPAGQNRPATNRARAARRRGGYKSSVVLVRCVCRTEAWSSTLRRTPRWVPDKLPVAIETRSEIDPKNNKGLGWSGRLGRSLAHTEASSQLFPVAGWLPRQQLPAREGMRRGPAALFVTSAAPGWAFLNPTPTRRCHASFSEREQTFHP